jgi:Aspartyl protease
MMKVYLKALLFFLPVYIQAQQLINNQQQAPFITQFGFKQYSGGVMIVQATINNIADTLNFILDTGSGGISLDSTTCEKYKIPHRITDTVITGMGVAHKVPFAFNQTLHFPGLDVANLNCHINNYEVLTSVYGEKIDGIIGYSFLSRYVVKINADSNIIQVFSIGNIKYPKNSYTLHPAFTTLPIIGLNVTDRATIGSSFFFDTGAGLCFLMSEKFAKDSNVLLIKRTPIVTQGEGMGGRLQMKLTVVKKVKVGKYAFKNVPSYIFDDEYNVTDYPFVGGLLGNDILRRFNIVLNYAQQEINIKPNSHYFDAFDYAYTGMSMYYIEGKIYVGNVVIGSPAYKAGLMADDIIVGVGTNFSNNIMQYKTMLQTANTKMNVLINRKEKLEFLIIKPISIY